MIESVGSEGKYQYQLITQASLLSIIMSMILYAASYLLASPEFYCEKTIQQGLNGVFKDYTYKCVEETFCNKYKEIYSTSNNVFQNSYWQNFPLYNPSSAENTDKFGVNWQYLGWTYDYGLICDKQSTRESYLMMTEMIPAMIGLAASILSDSLGRVYTFKLFTAVILGLSFIGAFVNNAFIKVLSLSLFIGEEAVLVTLFTYIINESCTGASPLRSRAIAFYFTIFAIGGLL